MRSPTYALIWEQWRQVRIPIAFAILLTAIASWTLRQIMEMSLGPNRKWLLVDSEDWGQASTILASICMILVMAALIFSHSSTRDLRMGLPQRLLTLPVASYRLANTQIIFRLVIVALVALMIGLSLTLIDAWYARMIAPLVGFSIFCYSYTSLVGTTIGKRNPVIALIVLIFTMSPVIVSINWFAQVPAPSDRSGWAMTGASLIAFGAFSAASLAVSIYRFATLRNASPVQVLLVTSQAAPVLRSRNAEDTAQYDFEWRRLVWLYPIVLAGITFTFKMTSFITAPSEQSFGQFLQVALITRAPIAAFIVGMILMAREHRDSVTGVSRFVWTRPVSVQQIAIHRMKATALSMLYTHLILFTLALLVALAEGELASVRIGAAFFGLAYGAAILIGVWSLIWIPYLPVAYWLTFLGYWGIFSTDEWGRREDIFLLWAPVAMFWFTFILLAASCYRRKIFELRMIARFGIFCLALAFAVFNIFVITLYHPNSNWKLNQLIPLAITMSALPLFALLWQGFFLDRVRHNALFRRLPPRGL